MPIQDLFSIQPRQGKLKQEKAIVSAVIKYFETAPSKPKSTTENTESSIIKALHRYFAMK